MASDRDERNEIVGTARDGLFAFSLVFGFLLVAKIKNTPTHRTIVRETKNESSTKFTYD